MPARKLIDQIYVMKFDSLTTSPALNHRVCGSKNVSKLDDEMISYNKGKFKSRNVNNFGP